MTKKPKGTASPQSDELEKLRPLIGEMIADRKSTRLNSSH